MITVQGELHIGARRQHRRVIMKKITTAVRMAVGAAALAVAAVAAAQPCGGMGAGFGPGMGGGFGPGMGMRGGPGMGPGYGARGAVDHAAVAEGRLAYLKSVLKITPAQESAWDAFATTSKAQAASMDAMREKMWQADGSAADRAQARAEAMQQRATVMAAASKALGSLYAVLTPEQKAVADQNMGHGAPYAGRFGRRAG
jgi:Spy/CpxP family protein refolding chaperone